MGQIIIDSQPIRKATKSNFLRSITQRRPPTQWAKGVGTKRERIRLQRDMINLQALLKAEAMGSLGSGYKRVFKEQAKVFEETAIAIGNGTRLRAKMLTKEWNPEEIALAYTIFEQASTIAFGAGALELQKMARSIYQSLIDRTYTRSRYVLGEANGIVNPNLAGRNEKLLGGLTLIQGATKRMADFHIQKSLEAQAAQFRTGIAWGEVVLTVKSAVENRIIIPSRLNTIARTEGGRAIDEGMKESAKVSDILTHMSVVGCQAIEPNIPTYNGIPTCNIEDVPVQDLDMVEFHINHTGAFVASRFKD